MDAEYNEWVSKIRVKDCIKVTVSAQFLESNFEMIKECLRKVSALKGEMNNFGKMNAEVYERLNYIQKETSDQKNAIGDIGSRLAVMEKKEFLDPIMRTIRDLETKTQLSLKNRENEGFDNMVKRLQALDRFVTSEAFKMYKSDTDSTLSDVGKLKNELDRYVETNTFKAFKDTTENNISANNQGLEQVAQGQKDLTKRVDKVDEKANKTANELNENNNMLKEINFLEMEAKLRKFKQDVAKDVSDMNRKLKRIVSTAELGHLEKVMVEKMDEYLLGMHKKTADRDQTKRALMFLQSRVTQLLKQINILIGAHTQGSKDESDPLFATRQWMCAACSTSLGKYEGKLGKYKPWSVFPCRELSPQKSGGYGYLTYVDKVSLRKGISFDDSNLERLNQTGQSFRRAGEGGETSRQRKMNSTATTNFMSGYGDNSEEYPRLKGEYFRNPEDHRDTSRDQLAGEAKETSQSKEEEEPRGLSAVRKTQRGFRVKEGRDRKLQNSTAAKQQAKPKDEAKEEARPTSK